MRTYADTIDDIRLELSDDGTKSRWTDAQILRVMGKAIRRMSDVLYRNDIEFGRSKSNFVTVAGQSEYPLPFDFKAPYGLYRGDTNARLQHETADSWEQLDNPAECSSWLLEGGNIVIAGAPTTEIAMTLRYWVMPNTTDMAADDPSPWDGRLDDIIAEYASLRLKNVDEMSVSFDSQLMQDMENNVLNTFGALDPSVVTRRGWLV